MIGERHVRCVVLPVLFGLVVGVVVSSTVDAVGLGAAVRGRVVSGCVVAQDGWGGRAHGSLTSWTRPNNSTLTYAWDPAGNLTGNAGVAQTFDQRNRMLTSGSTTYTWSARGTLTSQKVGTAAAVPVVFDGLGRQTGFGSQTSVYDSLDRVVTHAGLGFSYAGVEFDPVKIGAVLLARGPGGGLLAAKNGTAAAVLAGLDQHGDVGLWMSGAGTVTGSRTYTPFGAPVASTGTWAAPVGFQGDYTDTTSTLTWMGARWYRPGTATFTARDTVFGTLDTPISLNRYTYAWADPLGMFDPDGRCAADTGSNRQRCVNHRKAVPRGSGGPGSERRPMSVVDAPKPAGRCAKDGAFVICLDHEHPRGIFDPPTAGRDGPLSTAHPDEGCRISVLARGLVGLTSSPAGFILAASEGPSTTGGCDGPVGSVPTPDPGGSTGCGGPLILAMCTGNGHDDVAITRHEAAAVPADDDDKPTATKPGQKPPATEAAGVEGGLPKLGVKPNFQNPAEAPGSGWEWRGNGDPGSSKGSWYNPESGESLHPDLGHPDPIGPHYDWKAPNGVAYRVYPDGTVVEK